jgi:hypothetical protein
MSDIELLLNEGGRRSWKRGGGWVGDGGGDWDKRRMLLAQQKREQHLVKQVIQWHKLGDLLESAGEHDQVQQLRCSLSRDLKQALEQVQGQALRLRPLSWTRR